MTPAWNRDSAVVCKAGCDHSQCNHYVGCPVCGFNQQLPGYDCLACETVAGLYDADLRKLDVAKLAAAIGHARDVALAQQVAA